MTPLLDANIRQKHFADRLILQQVQVELHAGEFVTLVGTSGCGKSTLLRIIAGLDRDHDGEVRLRGRLQDGPTRDIGFIFQEPRLFPWLDVARNVAFDAGDDDRRSEPIAARVAELLHEVGLTGLGKAFPKQLSGGQAQRVAIARGLFNRPKLLLLDEPFSAVDAFTRMKLQDLLLRVADRHAIGVLMVTHDTLEAIHLSDRVLVMKADPGTLSVTLNVDLPRPRDREDTHAPALNARLRQALHAVHAF